MIASLRYLDTFAKSEGRGSSQRARLYSIGAKRANWVLNRRLTGAGMCGKSRRVRRKRYQAVSSGRAVSVTSVIVPSGSRNSICDWPLLCVVNEHVLRMLDHMA